MAFYFPSFLYTPKQLLVLPQQVRGWCQDCGFDPNMGHSIKSWTCWSLWVPSSSNSGSVILKMQQCGGKR